MIDRKTALIEQRDKLIVYMKSKIESEDWHAVQDAASDIREIESVLRELNRKY